MTQQSNASMISLLTGEQVCQQLDLTPASVDHLVETGELTPVRVSAGDDRRFWPDEVMVHALKAAMKADARADAARLASADQGRGPDGAAAPQHGLKAVVQRGRKPRRPAWPPFTGPVKHSLRAYIAFADRDHLVTYLRHRADVEVVPNDSNPARPINPVALASTAIRSIAALRPLVTVKPATIRG